MSKRIAEQAREQTAAAFIGLDVHKKTIAVTVALDRDPAGIVDWPGSARPKGHYAR